MNSKSRKLTLFLIFINLLSCKKIDNNTIHIDDSEIIGIQISEMPTSVIGDWYANKSEISIEKSSEFSVLCKFNEENERIYLSPLIYKERLFLVGIPASEINQPLSLKTPANFKESGDFLDRWIFVEVIGKKSSQLEISVFYDKKPAQSESLKNTLDNLDKILGDGPDDLMDSLVLTDPNSLMGKEARINDRLDEILRKKKSLEMERKLFKGEMELFAIKQEGATKRAEKRLSYAEKIDRSNLSKEEKKSALDIFLAKELEEVKKHNKELLSIKNRQDEINQKQAALNKEMETLNQDLLNLAQEKKSSRK